MTQQETKIIYVLFIYRTRLPLVLDRDGERKELFSFFLSFFIFHVIMSVHSLYGNTQQAS